MQLRTSTEAVAFVVTEPGFAPLDPPSAIAGRSQVAPDGLPFGFHEIDTLFEAPVSQGSTTAAFRDPATAPRVRSPTHAIEEKTPRPQLGYHETASMGAIRR